ncbi:MAG: hypothetical protein V9H69_24600 [Anaerolineae bacterium]
MENTLLGLSQMARASRKKLTEAQVAANQEKLQRDRLGPVRAALHPGPAARLPLRAHNCASSSRSSAC